MTEQHTEQYDAIGARWEGARALPTVHPERASFRELLGDLRGLSVLDLACGDGFYTRQARQLGARRVLGVDISAEMVAAGRRVERSSPMGVEYRVADAADLPDLGRFDVVSAAYLLNYARDEGTLTAMCRAAHAHLPATGRFVGVTQNPLFSFAGPPPDQYGFAFTPLETTDFGTRIRVTAALEPPITFETCLIRPEIYTAAFAAAGFRELRWVPLRVPAVSVRRFGADFWTGFLDNPPIVMFAARR